MILRKSVSISVLALLIISGAAAMSSLTAKGQSDHVDRIEIAVQTNKTTLLGEVATGDLDMCMISISRQNYEDLKESWKEKLGTWMSEGSYTNLYFNTAHEPDTDYKYLCNVSGELRFNPFAVRKVRYAANFLVNRKKICEDFADGFASPRYFWISSGLSLYQDRLKDIVERHNITKTGDKQKGLEIINNTLSSIDLKEGDLRSPSESNTSYWQYKQPGGNWSDVTVEGVHRTEDWRREIGDHVAGIFEEAGIKVHVKNLERDQAVPLVFSRDGSDLEWGYYTGEWLSSGNRYYTERTGIQMYIPSYLRSWVKHYYMYENQTLERLAEDFINGRINSQDEYWDKMEKMAEVGLNESLRVFLATEISFYAYDKDEVTGAVTDSLTGWSDFFTPRTIQTSDEVLDMQQYSSVPQLFMDTWNKYGGSEGASGTRQRRMIHDFGTYNNPISGLPTSIRCDWVGEKVIIDYEWNGDELTKNVEVPSEAVVYKTSTQRWKEVGSGIRSAVKVTYDVVEGKWHDGHDLTVRDVMAQYAFDKDMAFQDDRDPDYFYDSWSDENKLWYESIVATEWNADEGTYTIYGDQTYPQEDRIGQYYSKFPILPYQVYEAAGNLVAGTDLGSGMDEYAWDSAGSGNWVHWLSESQGQDFKSVLQNMKDQDWRPPYVKSENNSPIPISQSEYESQIDSIIGFYDQYKHFYDSNGPFKLVEYDSEQQTMSLDRFTKADGYPWSEDHWTWGPIGEMNIDTLEVPDRVNISEELSVNITAYIDEDFPTDVDRSVQEGEDVNVTVRLINSTSGELVEQRFDLQKVRDENNRSIYEATLSTDGIGSGNYTVEVEAVLEGQLDPSKEQRQVYLAEPSPSEENETIEIGSIDSSSESNVGDDLNVSLTAYINESSGGKQAVKEEDDADITVELINSTSGEVVAQELDLHKVKDENNRSTYEAILSTEGVCPGDYTLRAEATLKGQSAPSQEQIEVSLLKESSDCNQSDGGDDESGETEIPGLAVGALLPVIFVVAIYRWRRK